MNVWRILFALLIGLSAATHGSAQTYTLNETPQVGECFQVTVSTSLAGVIKVFRDGKTQAVKLSGQGQFAYAERTLDSKGNLATKTARAYKQASARVDTGNDRWQPTLRPTLQLIVAQRSDDGLVVFSPHGPMLRDEEQLLGDHFDTSALTGLLPNRPVALAESWEVHNSTIQALCLFEALIGHEIRGKLIDVKDGSAILRVEGRASGIDLGALVAVEVQATLKYDLLAKRIVQVEWKQKDNREPGPISPASEYESTTQITRSFLAEPPKELSTVALAAVPKEAEVPAAMAALQYFDPHQRFQLTHARDWHLVAATEPHTIMRLMDKGDFLSQATITPWKQLEAGKRVTPEEFKKTIHESPGWEVEEIIEEAEVLKDADRWIYRVSMKGELDEVKVVQHYYLIAFANGRHVVVSFTMKPGNVSKIGNRDLNFVMGLELPKK